MAPTGYTVIYRSTSTSTSDVVWSCWTATDCTSSSDTWRVWTNTSASTASTVSYPSEAVWLKWNTHNQRYDVQKSADWQPRQLTKEEVEQREKEYQERLRIAEAKAREEEKLRKAAEQRAKKLLLQNLNLEQKLAYNREKKFQVKAPSGKLYEIRHGWAGNVDELNPQGKPINRFCIHPRMQVPIPDSLLAQKLLLETDEEQFRKTANITQLCRN